MSIIHEIQEYKIVPVVAIKRLEDTLPTLNALKRGGLPIAEITFRTDCAAEAIRLAASETQNILIGAGTVLTGEQCKSAIDCGAQFIVSPGFSEEVLSVCRSESAPYIAGVVTPTEIMRAIACGLNVLKFFPSSDFGGVATLNTYGAVFPQVRFMPTGGVNEGNLTSYLSAKNVVACGGSWMLKGTFTEIEEKTKRAVKLAKGGEA